MAGALGGTLVSTVVIIVILIWVIKRRRRLQPIYDVPTTGTQNFLNPSYRLPVQNNNEEVVYDEIKDVFQGKLSSHTSGVYVDMATGGYVNEFQPWKQT